jgi:hypothetical protein
MSIKKKQLNECLTDIMNNTLIIPNFQREYIWNSDDVCALIASYFFQIRIGSFLFFIDSKKDQTSKSILPFQTFASNKIYANCAQDQEICGEIDKKLYVIDGQQRLTSTLIAFSKFYQNKELPRKFKRKYYIIIPLRGELFGLSTFKFSKPSIGSSKYDYDEFVQNHVIAKSQTASVPDEEDKYYLPLDAFQPHATDCYYSDLRYHAHAIRTKAFRKMLKGSESSIQECDHHSENAQKWEDRFYDYLKDVFQQDLYYIEVKDSLSEAIKTYEIINKSGKPLDDLDILAAHYSANGDQEESTKRLYDVIREGFSKNFTLAEILKVDRKKIFKRTKEQLDPASLEFECDGWNFSKFFVDREMNKDVPNKVRDQLIKMIKYISIDKDFSCDEKHNISSYKSDNILKMRGAEIKASIDDALQSISWAGMFMQIRCGICNASKINYYWQLFVLAAIKYELGEVTSEQQDILIAWFFLSRFSGRYRIDQNEHALEDLSGLLSHLNGVNEYPLLSQMLSEIKYDPNTNNITVKELRREVVTAQDEAYDIYPKIGDFVCEYSIRNGYESHIVHNYENNDLLVSSLLYPITGQQGHSLNIHHIFPLDSAKTIERSSNEIRKDDQHPYNSPMNKVFLTAKENNYIGTKKLEDYYNKLGIKYTGSAALTKQNDIKDMLDLRYEDFFSKLYTELAAMLI